MSSDDEATANDEVWRGNDELKAMVRAKLEEDGQLNLIKAQLRHAVHMALQQTPHDMSGVPPPKKTTDECRSFTEEHGQTALWIVVDLLRQLGLNCTLGSFMLEANLKITEEPPLSKLESQCGVSNDNNKQPLLQSLVDRGDQPLANSSSGNPFLSTPPLAPLVVSTPTMTKPPTESIDVIAQRPAPSPWLPKQTSNDSVDHTTSKSIVAESINVESSENDDEDLFGPTKRSSLTVGMERSALMNAPAHLPPLGGMPLLADVGRTGRSLPPLMKTAPVQQKSIDFGKLFGNDSPGAQSDTSSSDDVEATISSNSTSNKVEVNKTKDVQATDSPESISEVAEELEVLSAHSDNDSLESF